MLASEDGKLRIQQYEKVTSSKLPDCNDVSQQFKKDKYPEEIVYSSQTSYAKLIETT
ncbi:MAG: hypothetical protein M3264_15045 [Thermoproteota archaeon]|nr:hypothetical protein [Thermoproteota archaeon]